MLRIVDDLFEREEFSAAPDVGWPDCFNSGVFVFKPSEDTYNSLLQCAVTQGSFDGRCYVMLTIYSKGKNSRQRQTWDGPIASTLVSLYLNHQRIPITVTQNLTSYFRITFQQFCTLMLVSKAHKIILNGSWSG